MRATRTAAASRQARLLSSLLSIALLLTTSAPFGAGRVVGAATSGADDAAAAARAESARATVAPDPGGALTSLMAGAAGVGDDLTPRHLTKLFRALDGPSAAGGGQNPLSLPPQSPSRQSPARPQPASPTTLPPPPAGGGAPGAPVTGAAVQPIRETPRPVAPVPAAGANPDGRFNVAALPPVPNAATLSQSFPRPVTAVRAGTVELQAVEPVSTDLSPMCQPDSPNYPECDGTAPGGGPDPIFATPRTLLENETGEPGVDLGSRNFNWGAGLVSLPGRAGHDLNIGLSYNSLVWTKQGTAIRFNADRGFPGPGFRLGFPTIQQRYFNAEVGAYAYLMVTPSGGRVELRYTTTADGGVEVYEAADGSYAQMLKYQNGQARVRTTDGTQYHFIPSINNELRCDWIQDRNGNTIAIGHNGSGRPTQATDTLGHVVQFNYDAESGDLSSLTQARSGMATTLAWFDYTEIQVFHNFPGLTVNGPANGHPIRVLSRVTFADGSRYDFSYNSYGQVSRIAHHAPDGGLLSYTSYNLPGDAGDAQTDCPRFTERRDWVRYWNGDYDGQPTASEEAVTSYSVAGDGSWSQVTMPDGTAYKELFHTTGWQKGLTHQSEVWSGGARKKWTMTEWMQDNESLPYQLNPRPKDISIHDEAGNHRRQDILYTSSYGLPAQVREYSADGSGHGGFWRRTYYTYRPEQGYTDRRLIGLPDEVTVYDANNNLASKIKYHYDWGGEYLQGLAPSVGHDGGSYSTNFFWRGNVVGVQRFNVHAPGDPSQSLYTQLTGYDVAGSPVFTMDQLGHRTQISYGDNFSDGNNSRNTRAYPTGVTDPDNHSSSAQYHYDLGAVTVAHDPKGVQVRTTYDYYGRVERVTNDTNGGAYTRWEYPASMGHTYSYTVVAVNYPEAKSEEHYDGAGRVRATAVEFPGSAGGRRAVATLYDVMGRRYATSNPADVNPSWVPVGEDASDWRWTWQAYDWQGRPTLTTNLDTSTREMSYGGCGCAGGDVTTTRDERGRRKRYTKDVLGRLVRTEELNLDGSVYTTAYYSYNARDQLTQINHEGQLRTLGYDGHGRLQSRTTPEQGTTTYTYLADDTLSTVTDARGAVTQYQYNGRHLPVAIQYPNPPSGVGWSPWVTYTYDAAGNRTRMDDGQGWAEYDHNQLSQMTSERRHFNDLGATFTTSYSYNLAGQVTNVTNHWNASVSYGRDHTGLVREVGGAGYAGVSTYASNIGYRAWGAVKAQTYGNSRQLLMQYDNRMRLTRWEVPGINALEYGYDHFYENGGRVTYARNLSDPTLDRSYQYDQVGRLSGAYTGSEARAHVALPGSGWGTSDGPYANLFHYDGWGNLTWRDGWVAGDPPVGHGSYTYPYANNRNALLQYDASGNLTFDGANYSYDASGQQTLADNYPAEWNGYTLAQAYDGDRLRVKKVERGVATYYVRSSVLGGQVVAEVNGAGQWTRGYVYDGGGQLLAIQQGGVTFVHQDPVTKSQRFSDTGGGWVGGTELDPWGGKTNRDGGMTEMQPRKFTTYDRDDNGRDQAMHRSYSGWFSRFDQPDPSDGSYDLSDPQSFNRYAYTQNDPVNFVDPSGLNLEGPGTGFVICTERTTWDGVNLVVRSECRIVGGGGGLGTSTTPRGQLDPVPRGGGGGGRGGGNTEPQNPDDVSARSIVADAVEKALDILQRGCWTEQWNQDVREGDRYFAKVDNPETYTNEWKGSFSIHAKGVKESPQLPGGIKLMLDPQISFNFVLKYYPGQGMAVTSNTTSMRHNRDAIGYATGLDRDVNVRYAKEFSRAAPKCK